MTARHWEQDKDSTLYIGNLDERCSDSLVWELMLQCGPIINVHLPKDRVTQVHQGYGFVEFGSEEDADYACKIMNQIRVWGKPIRVNKASADKRITGPDGQQGTAGQGVGAELFVGNLDGMVDEKVLFETFSRFGPLLAPPKVARDDANLSKGYGFISYATFEVSDDAIANMHGQYLMNKEITVQYAYKKDGKGERHGDAAERALAAQAKRHGIEVSIPAMPAALVMPVGTPSGPAAMANGGTGGGFGGGAVRQPAPAAVDGYGGGYGGSGGVYTPQAPATPGYGAPQALGYGGYNNNPSPIAAAGGYNAFPPPNSYNHQLPPQQQSFYQQHTPIQQRHQPFPAPHAPIQQPALHAPPSLPPNPLNNRQQSTSSPLPPPPAGSGLPSKPPPSTGGYGGPPGAPPGFGGLPPGMSSAPPPGGFGRGR